MTKQKEQQAVLQRALKRAPFEGWTQAMLQGACEDAGFQSVETKRIFSEGVTQLLALYSAASDVQMAQAAEAMDLPKMKMPERIEAIVMARLNAHIGNREAIRRALAFYALPHNTLAGTQALYKTLDEIWHLAGDRSTDFSFYTRRMTLAGVFTSTVLFWLDDGSDGQQETRAFLKRRLHNVMQFHMLKKDLRGSLEKWLAFPAQMTRKFR